MVFSSLFLSTSNIQYAIYNLKCASNLRFHIRLVFSRGLIEGRVEDSRGRPIRRWEDDEAMDGAWKD